MKSPPKLTKENVRAFLDRPWHLFEEANAEHWREAQAADRQATFRAAAGMWDLMHELGHTSDDDARAADFNAHVRLRRLLERAALGYPRR